MTFLKKNLDLPWYHLKTSIISDFLLHRYSDCWYIIAHYCIMGNLKKNREKIKALRTICPKNKENFKNCKPRVQFYWFL